MTKSVRGNQGVRESEGVRGSEGIRGSLALAAEFIAVLGDSLFFFFLDRCKHDFVVVFFASLNSL